MDTKLNAPIKALGTLGVVAIAACSLAQRPISVEVDGQPVYFNGAQPQMFGGSVLIPLRGVFEKLGASVDWNERDQQVMARRGDTRIELKLNDHNAWVNGKSVYIPTSPMQVNGTTLVPIRFVSESLGAFVDWDPVAQLVSIKTATTYSNNYRPEPAYRMAMQPRGTVIPVKLDNWLSSDNSNVGDKFTATIDTKGESDYNGLPRGTKVEGHVNFVQPKHGDTPGVLGLTYDSIVMRDGTRIPIEASMIGLDNDSVRNNNGRLVAKKTRGNKDDMKYVGTGAGAGAVLALVTKGNVITNAVIGGALGYLYQQYQRDQNQVKNVELERGAALGVRLDQDTSIRIYE